MSVKAGTPGEPEVYYFDKRYAPDAVEEPVKKAAKKAPAKKAAKKK